MTILDHSCSEPVLPLGRRPIALDQSGGGDNYPFVYKSELNYLIADAYLAYRDPECRFERPFRIRWLYGFGCLPASVPFTPVHDYDLLIEDALGEVVFDSRLADVFRSDDWSDRLRVLQWHVTEQDAVLRVVQHIAASPDQIPQAWRIFIQPVNSRLDVRVSECLLPRLRSLRTEAGDPLNDRLRLGNGFNTTLTVTPRAAAIGGRLVTEIKLESGPGIGKGKFGPACDEDTTVPLRRINNIQADSGNNFRLDATDCMRLERPVFEELAASPRRVAVRNHALELFADCGPCCDCADFINTYEGIRRLRNRYADLFARAIAVRDLYKKNLERFEAQAACRAADPLRVVIRPICPNEIAVAIGFCNLSSRCLYNLIIPISFDFTPGGGSVSECEAHTDFNGSEGDPATTCNSTFRSGNATSENNQNLDFYQLAGEYPNYYAAWDRVDPGSMATVTFRVIFPDSQIGDSVAMMVDAYGTDNASIPLGSDSDVAPIPGYILGRGPTTPEAMGARLVEHCKVARTSLLQAPCCS